VTQSAVPAPAAARGHGCVISLYQRSAWIAGGSPEPPGNAPVALFLFAVVELLTRYRRAVRQGHFGTELVGDLRHRRNEVEIVEAHGEVESVAMRTAAETVKEVLLVDHAKRRRSLAVEWAQPDKFPLSSYQLDAAATDQTRQPLATAQLVEICAWEQRRHQWSRCSGY
jgi:hypothetical protein